MGKPAAIYSSFIICKINIIIHANWRRKCMYTISARLSGNVPLGEAVINLFIAFKMSFLPSTLLLLEYVFL
jgi:hypothetical protein